MVKSKQKSVSPKIKQSAQSIPELNSIRIGDTDIFQYFSHLLSASLPSADSPSVLILASQREKILSIKSWFKKNSSFTITALTPGTGTNTEIAALQKSCQVLIASPDRLFFHLDSQNVVSLSSVRYYFIDQFEQLLESPHASQAKNLLSQADAACFIQILASKLTGALNEFSTEFGRLKLINEQKALPEIEASQQYVLIDPDKKFLLLHTFLFKNQQKKIVVLFNTSNEVIFYSQMLKELGIPNKSIHSFKSPEKVKSTCESFLNSPSGFLLSTYDSLQGVKNLAKDFLIVFDLNEDQKLIICAEQVSCDNGKIIIFAVEQEKEILARTFPKATTAKVPSNKIWNIQEKIEKIVKRNYEMHKKAREGYKNYILSTKLKDYHKLAKNFGLEKAFLVNNLS